MPGTEAENVRFLTWNIRQGGGTRRLPQIVLGLLSHRPDVVALTEFHIRNGGSIRGVLADAGLSIQLVAPAPPEKNSILLACRPGLGPVSEVLGTPPAGLASRWLDCRLAAMDLSLSVVHIPDDSRKAEKLAYWQFLIELARKRRETPWIVLGDVNSGRHFLDEPGATFAGTPLLGTFSSLGMLDAWRSKNPCSDEHSWSGPALAASRIDACYLSSPLHKCLENSHFSHAERQDGFSDHSALIVDLLLGPSRNDPASAARTPPSEGSQSLFQAWKRREVSAPTVQTNAPANRQKGGKIGGVADGCT